MTQEERIEMLAKLCLDYMADLNKVETEGYEIARKLDNNEPGVSITQLELTDKKMRRTRNKFVNPITNLLRSEGVKLMKMEGTKLILYMEDNREIEVDTDKSDSSIEIVL